MPLEHLQLLTVLQANNVIGPDRLLDRHGRNRFGCLYRRLTNIPQGLVNLFNQARQSVSLNRIVLNVCRNDLGC